MKSLIFLALIAVSVQGLNIDDAKEKTCVFDVEDPSFTAANLQDLAWLKTWSDAGNPVFIPAFSYLDASRLAQSLYGKIDISFLTWKNLAQSCIYAQLLFPPKSSQKDKLELQFFGFCGKTFTKFHTDVDGHPGVQTWPSQIKYDNENMQDSGIIRFVLIKQNAYVLATICWGDGYSSWAVFSPTPVLAPCDKEAIEQHLISLGYNRKYFFGIDYEVCSYICQNPYSPFGPYPGVPGAPPAFPYNPYSFPTQK